MYTWPVWPSLPVWPSHTLTIWAIALFAFAGGRCLITTGLLGLVASTISVPSFSHTPLFSGFGNDPVQPPPPVALCRPAKNTVLLAYAFAGALPIAAVLLGYLCTVG